MSLDFFLCFRTERLKVDFTSLKNDHLSNMSSAKPYALSCSLSFKLLHTERPLVEQISVQIQHVDHQTH